MISKEFLISKGIKSMGDSINAITVQKYLIEFAQYHVREALLNASRKAKCSTKYKTYAGSDHDGIHIDKGSILNSYPSENIK